MRLLPARKVGSELKESPCVRRIVKSGSNANPASAAARASSTEPTRANAAANWKCAIGKFRLASRDRRSHSTASLSAPRINFTAKQVHPPKRVDVARGKPERLLDVSLAFCTSSNEDLHKSKQRVGFGQIAIKLQCLFAFSNRQRCALRE